MTRLSVDDEWLQFLSNQDMGKKEKEETTNKNKEGTHKKREREREREREGEGEGEGEREGERKRDKETERKEEEEEETDDEGKSRSKRNRVEDGNEKVTKSFNYDNLTPSVPTHLTPPKATSLYISTQTKIAFFVETTVNLDIFWDIPVIPYWMATNGVIKKQINLSSASPAKVEEIERKMANETTMCEQHILKHIDNPNGRMCKYKDVRKITVGMSKKDILCRSKKKQAFYNCFVLILRINIDDVFREFHVKVFNTGKLEIPGLQSAAMFEAVLRETTRILQPLFPHHTLTISDRNETVLINSNFKCNYYIKREVLCDILKHKYNIQTIYDPCSYQGIQCKFYYNGHLKDDEQTGEPIPIATNQTDETDETEQTNMAEVSFMIFRTGSVLISGMCNENVLQCVYRFLKRMFEAEFFVVCQHESLITMSSEPTSAEKKKKAFRKKVVNIFRN